MHEDIAEILLSDEEIQAKVVELGQRITADYRGKNLLLLGTLKGAVPFIGDLARAIKLPLEIDYMAISRSELGQRITADYRGKNLLLLGTLKGAVPFIGDLARAIKLPLEIDYMAIS